MLVCQPVKYVIHVHAVAVIVKSIKFPIHKVWWLREASHIGQNVHITVLKSRLKPQPGRIPIEPAILAAIGHRFTAKKPPQNKSNKNRRLVWPNVRQARKQTNKQTTSHKRRNQQTETDRQKSINESLLLRFFFRLVL